MNTGNTRPGPATCDWIRAALVVTLGLTVWTFIAMDTLDAMAHAVTVELSGRDATWPLDAHLEYASAAILAAIGTALFFTARRPKDD